MFPTARNCLFLDGSITLAQLAMSLVIWSLAAALLYSRGQCREHKLLCLHCIKPVAGCFLCRITILCWGGLNWRQRFIPLWCLFFGGGGFVQACCWDSIVIWNYNTISHNLINMTGNLQALCKVRIAMREHFLCPRIFSVYIIFVLDEDYNDDIRLCKWLCLFYFFIFVYSCDFCPL